MSAGPAVSNSSPIIALDQIRRIDLLEKLFLRVWVPPAVIAETSGSVAIPPWIVQRELKQPVGPQILGSVLGSGESEALSLALEVGASWMLLDDRPARRLATALSLPVVGTLGILLAGKRRGFVTAVRPHVDELINNDFRVSGSLYRRVLLAAGEAC